MITKTFLFGPADKMEPTFGFILKAGISYHIRCYPHIEYDDIFKYGTVEMWWFSCPDDGGSYKRICEIADIKKISKLLNHPMIYPWNYTPCSAPYYGEFIHSIGLTSIKKIIDILIDHFDQYEPMDK